MKGAVLTKAARFSPYREYCDSGFKEPARIPRHWTTRPLKFALRVNSEVLPEETSPDLAFRYVDIRGVDSHGEVVTTEELTFDKAPSRARRVVRSGDTIISTVRTYLKAIAYFPEVSEPTIVSTGFAVLRPGREWDPSFLRYAIQADYFLDSVVSNSQGIGYPAIAPSQLGSLTIIVPSLAEQSTIASFLDRETAKIDALIAKKERLIDLLQEKRAALVTRAVTKGLDQNVPMKTSGLEWSDLIPSSWDVLPNRDLFSQRDERGRPELPILEVSISSGVTIREFSDDKIEQKAQDLGSYKVARKGDIAFNKMRMWQGAVGVAPTDGLVSPDYTVAEPTRRANAYYFAELFRTGFYQTEVYRYSHGIVDDRNRLYWQDFKSMKSPVPTIEEQARIMNFVHNASLRFQALADKVRVGIDRLKEYRTALISAAVTGKIDVRDQVAA